MGNLNLKYTKEGQIYYYKGSSKHIFKCSKNGSLKYSSKINISNESFSKDDEMYFSIESELRLATPEEENWLNLAISEGKYVPKPEYTESNNYEIY